VLSRRQLQTEDDLVLMHVPMRAVEYIAPQTSAPDEGQEAGPA
jgi:hypothetical protein